MRWVLCSAAAALWAVDTSLNLARSGPANVNFCGGWGYTDSPIEKVDTATGREPVVMPMYYAMPVVQQAIGGKATHFAKASVTTSLNLRAYARAAAGG